MNCRRWSPSQAPAAAPFPIRFHHLSSTRFKPSTFGLLAARTFARDLSDSSYLRFLSAGVPIYIEKHLPVLSGRNPLFASKFPDEIRHITVPGVVNNFLNGILARRKIPLHLVASECEKILGKRLTKKFFDLLTSVRR